MPVDSNDATPTSQLRSGRAEDTWSQDDQGYIMAKVRGRLHDPKPAATRIGRFIVLDSLGQGAMGAVYAAYDERLDRKIAIKVMREDDLPTEESRLRFEREAQALARLSHPNVVTVHEVGDHDGELYIAMEFIRGQSMASWIRTTPGWPEVLEAYLQAGRGLSAAHEVDLVHRDLKPHNLMRSDDGVVKVLDFGLARVIGDESEASIDGASVSSSALTSSLTVPGTIMGTPVYMSPEQVHGSTVDARSDQFSFCVALYEGLYGQRPYPEASLQERITAVMSGDVLPIPKGTKVPSRIHGALLRGLEPDPGARWPSMHALLQALSSDPRRRRNRWLLGLAGIAGLGLGGAALARGTAGPQTTPCTGASARLDGLWDEARRGEAEAAILGIDRPYAADVWQRTEAGLDRYTTAWVAMHTAACEASLRGEQSGALLDLRMRCLDRRLEHVGATVDVLRSADQTVVTKATQSVAQLPPLERCEDVEALTAELPPPEDPAVRARADALYTQLIEAKALERAGKYDEGLRVAQEAASAADQLGYEPLQVQAWLDVGALLGRKAEYEQAEKTIDRAYESAMGLRMVEHAAEATRHLVQVVGVELARYEEARRWAKHAKLLARAVGTDRARARYLGVVGAVALKEGDLERAQEHFEQALVLLEQVAGPDEASLLVSPLSSLGVVAKEQGRPEDAREYHERALTLAQDSLGPEHPEVFVPLNNLGAIAMMDHQFERAHGYFERALAIKLGALGPDHPDVARAHGQLGLVLVQQGKLEQAHERYEKTRAILEKALGPDHPDLAVVLGNHGILLKNQGKIDEAIALSQRALSIRKKALGVNHHSIGTTLFNLSVIETEAGRLEDARKHLDEAYDILVEVHGPDHYTISMVRFAQAELVLSLGDLEQSRTYLEQALAIQHSALGPDHSSNVSTLALLGDVLSKLGDHAGGIARFEQALALLAKSEGSPIRAGAVRLMAAEALWDAPTKAGRDRARARELAELAATTLEATGDPGAKNLAEAREWLATHGA